MTRGKALGLEAEVIPSWAIRTSFQVPFFNASLGPRLLLLGHYTSDITSSCEGQGWDI